MFLKERLYKNTMPKTLSNVTKGLLAKPALVEVKNDEQIYNDKPVMKFPILDKPTSSERLNKNFRSDKTNATHSLKHHQTQL